MDLVHDPLWLVYKFAELGQPKNPLREHCLSGCHNSFYDGSTQILYTLQGQVACTHVMLYHERCGVYCEHHFFYVMVMHKFGPLFCISVSFEKGIMTFTLVLLYHMFQWRSWHTMCDLYSTYTISEFTEYCIHQFIGEFTDIEKPITFSPSWGKNTLQQGAMLVLPLCVLSTIGEKTNTHTHTQKENVAFYWEKKVKNPLLHLLNAMAIFFFLQWHEGLEKCLFPCKQIQNFPPVWPIVWHIM